VSRAALLAAVRSADAIKFRASAVADEVAHEVWRGALRSLDRFGGSPPQQRP
jgi:hypothetical protein